MRRQREIVPDGKNTEVSKKKRKRGDYAPRAYGGLNKRGVNTITKPCTT